MSSYGYTYKKPNNCPFAGYGRMRDCVKDFCHWYDEKNKQCVIHTIADRLKGGVTDET